MLASSAADASVYVDLLLRSGKSVLLAGAPGTGKTRLAFIKTQRLTGIEPIVVVGRGDLSAQDLLYTYEMGENGFRIVLGELALSVLSSWARICNGLSPRWIVFDELNRMNAEIVLGRLFTALDIANRTRIPLLPQWLIKHVIEDKSMLEMISVASRLDVDEVKYSINRVFDASRFSGLDGVPLPLSWRSLATVNLVDRSHLFRLGFALLRRFPIVLFPGLFKEIKPEINNKQINIKYSNSVYNLLINHCESALRELLMKSELCGEDRVTYAFIDSRDKILDSVKEKYKNALIAVAAILDKIIDKLGNVVEIGPALLVDACRMAIIAMLTSTSGIMGIDDSVLADAIVASIILPQLGSIAPALKMKLLFQGDSGLARKVTNVLETVEDVLGDKSMAVQYIGALRLELPLPPV